MARGGFRPGAGRKKGVPNRKTAEQIKAVSEAGLTPLEFLLTVMRDEKTEMPARIDAAKAAAPYVHPRLQTTTHEGGEKPVQQEHTVRWLR